MLQQNPEAGARMGALIRNPEYTAKLLVVKEASTRLRSEVEAAKQAVARFTAAKAILMQKHSNITIDEAIADEKKEVEAMDSSR